MPRRASTCSRSRDPDMDEPDGAGARRPKRGTDLPLTLDASGGARATVKDIERAGPAARPPRRARVPRPQRRDADGATRVDAVAVARRARHQAGQLGRRTRSGSSSPWSRSTSPASRWPACACSTDAFKRDYYSHRRRLIGGFYAYEHGYDTTRVGRPLQRRRPNAQGLLDLRDGAARDRQPHPARAGRRCRRPRRARARRRVGRGRRRPVVRRVRQRPHRPPAREEALRARRHRALPGAHAVQGRDRARHRRARRRARRVRDDGQPRRSRARGADQGQLRAERVRLGVPRARTRRRRRADGARRSRQAVVQDGPRASCASAGRRTSSR